MTANDEIPIWDAEATGEPTKKVTAQQLAVAVVALAAVAKSGDTMTGPLIVPEICSANAAYPAYSFANAQNTHVADIYYDIGNKSFIFRYDPNGQEEHYVLPTSTGSGGHYILTDKSPVTIPQGGTGATNAADARANFHAMQNPDDSIEMRTTGNLNDAPAGFSVYSDSCVNSPFTFWTSILTICVSSAGYRQQIAFPWNPGEMRIAYRVCEGGTWKTWRFIDIN